jgi:preprotein translocase subunit SecG
MGGQSAFGAKAGDTFTRVTIVAAAFWIVLCIVGVKVLGQKTSRMQLKGPATTSSAPADTNPASPQDKATAPAPAGASGAAPASAPAAAPAGAPASAPAQPATPAGGAEKGK